jgi:hypothetical protein
MTEIDAGEPHGLWPSDLNERAERLLTFIVGHLLVSSRTR